MNTFRPNPPGMKRFTTKPFILTMKTSSRVGDGTSVTEHETEEDAVAYAMKTLGLGATFLIESPAGVATIRRNK